MGWVYPTKRNAPGSIPVRAKAWVVGSDHSQDLGKSTPINILPTCRCSFPSLSTSLPLSIPENK